jgi:hypothetical protein
MVRIDVQRYAGYLVNVEWGNKAVGYLKGVLAFKLPHPICNIYLAFVCYYIMLCAFGIRPYLAIAGALAFGLSSYMVIGLSVGHSSRIGAIAFMPLVMAEFILRSLTVESWASVLLQQAWRYTFARTTFK